jgi:predicted transcriptional regulator
MLTQAGLSAYADVMDTRMEIAESAASTDPEVGLRAVAALRVLTEELETLQVDRARRAGWSWQDIAARLGVTKQTVHRKHGRRIRGQA